MAAPRVVGGMEEQAPVVVTEEMVAGLERYVLCICESFGGDGWRQGGMGWAVDSHVRACGVVCA